MNEIIINNENGMLTVSSREVAETFEKRHDHIVRAIEETISSLGSPQNWGHLFIECKYQNEQNKQWYKQYEMTRDGFTLAVMGFTGAKALEWKLKYIEAFNSMEQQIKSSAAAFESLSPQLQLLINIETQQKQQTQALAETNKRIDSLGEVIALDTNS